MSQDNRCTEETPLLDSEKQQAAAKGKPADNKNVAFSADAESSSQQLEEPPTLAYNGVSTEPPVTVPTITCRVCHASIDISGKTHQHVVKCPQCTEATPIRPPPPGRKYVRCPCNCLLICNQSSSRIACPRANCKRVITLGLSPIGRAVRAPPGTQRISCAYCDEIFMYNVLNKRLAKCPHCGRV
ncbi:unnamed protein product [Soboliphyme baturini]|uniref:Phosphatidylinositol-4,5-bisphosphate 4-phosphatase n=1 Tax=Soboliphyme baturini TaxID=241478 RepID=A0A183IZ39_9BILA|nr:unnamed protein product [Soboliphyme baturini]